MTCHLATPTLGLLVILTAASCNRTKPTPLPQAEPQDIGQPSKTEKEADVPPSPARVETSRYQKDLNFIAAPRPPGSKHWQAVQELCKNRLQALGYDVVLDTYGTGTNVIGTRKGAKSATQVVILSAHYDSIDDVCHGADDNGSGVAGLLEAARVLADQPHDRTLIIACWDQEETGLVGSRSYANAARKQNHDIRMMFALEMIGYASQDANSQTVPLGFDMLFPKAIAAVKSNQMRGDFIALVHDDSPAATAAAGVMSAHGAANSPPALPLKLTAALKNSPVIGDLRRSDHAAFWEQDYPAMMITDTANFRNTHYHCAKGQDSVERLDPVFASGVVSATIAAVRDALKVP